MADKKESGIAKLDRGLRKAGEDIKNVAPIVPGVAKTFLKGTPNTGSEKDIDYGPGPKPPTAKAQSPPDDWYKAYGKSASSTGKKVGTKKGRRKRSSSK